MTRYLRGRDVIMGGVLFSGEGYFSGVGGAGPYAKGGRRVFGKGSCCFFSGDFRIGFAFECLILLLTLVKAYPKARCIYVCLLVCLHICLSACLVCLFGCMDG